MMVTRIIHAVGRRLIDRDRQFHFSCCWYPVCDFTV